MNRIKSIFFGRYFFTIVLILLFDLFINNSLYSQSTIYRWHLRMPNANTGVRVIQSNNNHIIAIGNNLLTAGFIYNLNETGNLHWSKRYEVFGADFTQLVGLVATSDNGCLLLGNYGYNTPPGAYHGFMIMLDSTGTILWSKSINKGTPSSVDCNGIAAGHNNSFLIFGRVSQNTTGNDLFITCIDSSGATLWSHIYDLTNQAVCKDIVSTYNGGYFATGEYANITTGFSTDAFLMSLDSTGSPIWFKAFGTTEQEYGSSIIQTADTNIVFTGSQNINNTNNSTKSFLVKTNLAGDTLWTRIFENNYKLNATSVIETFDGNLLMSITSIQGPLSNRDFCLLKLNSSGDTLFTQFTSSEAAFSEVIEAADATYIGVGASYSDMYMIKTDLNGNTGCFDHTHQIAQDQTNFQVVPVPVSIIASVVPGTTPQFIIGSGPAVQQVCISTGGETPAFSYVERVSIYPTLFSNQLNVQNLTANKLYIKLFDSTGKNVINHYVNNSSIINTESLSKGLYFYLIRLDNDEIITGKIIKN